MDSNKKRLERIARALKPMHEEILTVKMADGSERRLPAPDIIPLMLLDGDKKVIDVIGDGGTGNGQLADLFRGIIHEAPEVIL